MNIRNSFASLMIFFGLFSSNIQADTSTMPVAIGGYDLVSYHQSGGPIPGTGHHVVEHSGVSYLFASAENKVKFEASPSDYLPAYGGYCAFGASLGKKFYGDPRVWKVVDGTLYLNLDAKIQKMWVSKLDSNIVAADELWSTIKYTPAAEL
jgi:YHS domain-containing protein